MPRKKKEVQGQDQEVMSEEKRILAAVMNLPLPADLLASQDDGNLAIVAETYGYIEDGIWERDDIEAFLLAGEDITPQMVVAAARALESWLAQYRAQVFTAIRKATTFQETDLARWGTEQSESAAKRDGTLGRLDEVADAYQAQIENVQLLKGFFDSEITVVLQAETEAAAGEETKGKRRPGQRLQDALRRSKGSFLDKFVYVSPPGQIPQEGEAAAQEHEMQLLDDIGAFTRLTRLPRERALGFLQKMGRTVEEMVERVLEAEEVFRAGAERARAEHAEQSRYYGERLSLIEGGIAAAEGALAGLTQREKEITEAVQALEAQIAAIRKMFPA